MLLKADTEDVASTISEWLKDVEIRGFVKYIAYNEDDESDSDDDDDNGESYSPQEHSGKHRAMMVMMVTI